MSTITLDFLNKNLYRRYPIRMTSTLISEEGVTIPQSLLAAVQISTIYTTSDVYISKIYIKNTFLSILITDAGTSTDLGVFKGYITSNYQVLPMEAFVPYASGTLTFGAVEALGSLAGSHSFSVANGRIEASAVFVYPRPEVTSITHDESTLTGKITFTGGNVLLAYDNPEIDLSIRNRSSIMVNNDVAAAFGNCPTRLIRKINTVEPDEDGNIDIYGILPAVIDVDTNTVSVTTPDFDIFDVCPEKNLLLPPTDNTSDEYGADILTTDIPEWKTWPQFD